MPTTLSRPVRTLLIVLVIGLLAVSVGLGAALVSERSPGSLWAELRGNTEVEHPDSAADVTSEQGPDWLPGDADEITVVRSGPNADVEGSRIDARVPEGSTTPESCVASKQASLPWDGGGRWPDFTLAETLTCGDWHLVARPHHWYAWSR